MTTSANDLQGEWRDRCAIPDHVIWGPGSHERLRVMLEEMGCNRALLLTSGSLKKHTPWVDRIEEALGGLVVAVRSDSREFTPDWLCFDTARQAREVQPDVIVTVGGGSVADWGKAVAFILAQGLESVSELDDYVASPDNQRLAALPRPPIPQVAIPTTLSASEATWSVTINRPERKFKDHVRHPDLVPKAVILDAAIASSTPAGLWCATGLKAMEHVVEKLYTVDRNPVVDNMCLKAGELLYRHLPRCKDNPEDLEAFTQCHVALVGVGFHGRGVHKGLSQVIGWQLGAYGVVPRPHVLRHAAPRHGVQPFRQPLRPGRSRPGSGRCRAPRTTSWRNPRRPPWPAWSGIWTCPPGCATWTSPARIFRTSRRRSSCRRTSSTTRGR